LSYRTGESESRGAHDRRLSRVLDSIQECHIGYFEVWPYPESDRAKNQSVLHRPDPDGTGWLVAPAREQFALETNDWFHAFPFLVPTATLIRGATGFGTREDCYHPARKSV